MMNTMMDAWSSFALSPWQVAPFGFSAAPRDTTPRGQFSDLRLHTDHGALRYKLFVPSGYTPGTPLPLLLMLHGCGQDADDFANGTGMNELAETEGCLVAYPEQSSSANANRCWNWYEQAHHERGRGEPALIAALTRHIMAEYAVDRRRVWVAGLSSGGAMAVILGRTYPDLFNAVGSHSGLAHGSARDRYGAMLAMRDGVDMVERVERATQAAGVPIIVFHGDGDSTVHVNNSVGIVMQSMRGHGGRAIELLEEAGQFGGRRFTRHIHRDAHGRHLIEHWTVHGGGHAWSGGNWRGTYTDSVGPDTSREMLRFFMQQ